MNTTQRLSFCLALRFGSFWLSRHWHCYILRWDKATIWYRLVGGTYITLRVQTDKAVESDLAVACRAFLIS